MAFKVVGEVVGGPFGWGVSSSGEDGPLITAGVKEGEVILDGLAICLTGSYWGDAVVDAHESLLFGLVAHRISLFP